MNSGYWKQGWALWRGKLKHVFHYSDSRVDVYMGLNNDQLCNEHLKRGNTGAISWILAYSIFSCSNINKGALGEYSQLEMLVRILSRDMIVNVLL